MSTIKGLVARYQLTPGAFLDPAIAALNPIVGSTYVVARLEVGRCHTDIWVYSEKGVAGPINSIYFDLSLEAVVYAKPDEKKGPCGCGAMFALKALVEASSKRWNEERDQDGSFVDALGRAQALTGMPPFKWDKETKR